MGVETYVNLLDVPNFLWNMILIELSVTSADAQHGLWQMAMCKNM